MSMEVSSMEMSPKNQLLNFILLRANDFYQCVKNPESSAEEIETSILCLVAFVPSEATKVDLQNYYFAARDKYNVKVASILTCAMACQQIAASMDLISQDVGAFV